MANTTKIKTLLNGYSGKCTIDGDLVLLTSFSLSVNMNHLQSGGIGKLLDGSKLKRYGLSVIRDFPSYDLNLSFQMNESIFQKLIGKIEKHFTDSIDIEFEEEAFGITYKFDDCYVKSFSFSIGLNQVCVANLGLAYFKESFKIKKAESSKISSKYGTDDLNKMGKLMPYYYWSFKCGVSGKTINKDLVSGSFSFNREITPKFGCQGASSKDAQQPLKLHLGLPSCTFQLSYLYADNAFESEINVHEYNSIECLNEKNNLIIKYKGNSKLECQQCIFTTFSPNMGNSGSYNTLNISGKVFGKIQKK